MTDLTEELKRCPFCGGKAHVKEDYVECTTCGVFIVQTSFGKGDGIHQVINRWNARHYPPEVQQAVERMKPKKVINIRENGFVAEHFGNCPTCNDVVNDYGYKHYCWFCGQRLKWSE